VDAEHEKDPVSLFRAKCSSELFRYPYMIGSEVVLHQQGTACVRNTSQCIESSCLAH